MTEEKEANQVCPKCEGRGNSSYTVIQGGAAIIAGTFGKCPKCNGTGKANPMVRKIAGVITGKPSKMLDGTDDPLHEMDVDNKLELANQIIAITGVKDCWDCHIELDEAIEAVRKEERERIIKWGEETCREWHFMPNSFYPKRRRECLTCWQSLKKGK